MSSDDRIAERPGDGDLQAIAMAALPALAGGSRMSVMFRALRSRNYRLFFGGQLISLIGTWLTTAAMSWVVYRITGSTAAMGAVAFCGQLPAFLLAPLAGVMVDRLDQRRMLMVTQSLSMCQSAALAILALTHTITLGYIVALQICQGLVNALDMPARQAIVVRLVDRREDLPNAIALNSSIFNVARALGPAIAGLLIWLVGEGYCFSIDAISYVAVIVALWSMRLAALKRPARKANVLGELRDGLTYISRSVPIRAIFLLLALVSLTCVPFSTFMPVFARRLGCSAMGFGVLSAAPGAGALVAAIYLASRRTVVGLGRLIPMAGALMGVSLIVFAASPWFWFSILVLPFAGLGMILQMASSNTLLQVLSDDDKRGRVMSIYIMLFMGITPIGNLVGGQLAQRFGTPITVAIGGAAGVVGAAWFAAQLPKLRHAIRPIYLQRGIIVAAPAPTAMAAEAAVH
jgi:MFS family permease